MPGFEHVQRSSAFCRMAPSIQKASPLIRRETSTPPPLAFPASLVFSGEFLYVTNLALDLRLFMLPQGQAVDSQWAAQVRKYTVSRLRARIPRGDDDDETD